MEKPLDEKTQRLQPGPTEEWLKTGAFREQWNKVHSLSAPMPEPAFRVIQSADDNWADNAHAWRRMEAQRYSTLPGRLAKIDLSGLDTEAMLVMFNVQFPHGAVVKYDTRRATSDDIYWLAVCVKLWRQHELEALSDMQRGVEMFKRAPSFPFFDSSGFQKWKY